MSKVAVVILNYNGTDYLKEFLPSVIQHTPEAEIIVADNCSTDHSLDVLKNQFPGVRIIILPENYGYAGGYNECLKQVEAEYYLLLNSDVEVTPNWLEPLVEYLDDHPDYAAVQPKLLDYNNKEYFEYAGAAGGFIDQWGYPYCRGRVFDVIEHDSGQYDSFLDIHWCSGACFLIRSKVFHELGGFDTDFFAHMEEIDLCWRMMNRGFLSGYLPQSKVFHVGGGTLNKTSPNKTYLNFRNNMAMLIKNLPWPTLLWIYPLRVILDFLAALKMWSDQGSKHFMAVIRSHAYVIKNSRRILRKRSVTKRIPSQIRLLEEFYIRKRKTFSSFSSTK
ncbi:glycosyltransferase family 2 protein [Marinoscillum sp. MHG1-6]|uniref:glycosyltransferase family 2 protein n=1 Tax=Marinoscillum sp. MHG1-6 TaxID=2959627 RepID=UPI002157356C|nr:glycosyltransferase family 2 protein [Marinoscillum sp. MHG1-6]